MNPHQGQDHSQDEYIGSTLGNSIDTTNNDTIIAVDDQSVPQGGLEDSSTAQRPALSPLTDAHPITSASAPMENTDLGIDHGPSNDDMTTASGEFGSQDPVAVHPMEERIQAVLSRRRSSTFQPSDPSTAYQFPSARQSGGYTPTIQSERLPGHQQSSTPYSSSIRNEYPTYYNRTTETTHQQQHHVHHHNHRHHAHHPNQSSGTAGIDYAGLDTFINEIDVMETGYDEQPTSPVVPDQDSKEYAHSLERAVSSGSASAFGSGFRRRSARKASYYSERAPRPPLPEQLRYTFYSRAIGLIEAPTLPKILSQASMQGDPGSDGPNAFSDLLKDGCFWIDVLDPSDVDMQMVAKYFNVHPLTIEDISTEEVREKYEVFRNYYFVCFRTFDQDYNSGSYLQPASMYSVVLREGIITFHFRPTTHHMNVLRRLEQFHSHITLTPDWINYALLDDITDSFASPIQTIEYEVDSIDELVLLLRENETSDMLRRIGSCRKNVMAISRLLTNKADVIRGLMKRFDERFLFVSAAGTSAALGASAGAPPTAQAKAQVPPPAPPSAPAPLPGAHLGAVPTGHPSSSSQTQPEPVSATAQAQVSSQAQPQTRQPSPAPQAPPLQHQREGEIMLYLGDILDHVFTMLQSLNSYEKILARSHSNYLAQISLEINQLSNKTNEVVGTLTFFASLIVPMTFVAGLWGMNVHVPGQPGEEGKPLDWWWGICGGMLLYSIVAVFYGKRYGLI